MRHFSKHAIIVFALVSIVYCAGNTQAQNSRRAQQSPSLITGVRVALPPERYYGPLYVTIGGRERKIADEAMEAWIIQGGSKVVYSGRDGAGGFENEGQSLRAYDVRTGRHRKILSEYYGVTDVEEVTTRMKRTALLVEMADGGLGASYLAVVDPERGEVFFRRWARIISRRGDQIVIGHYREDDWAALNEDANKKITPYRKERHNLNAILKRRVIYNKRDR